MLSDSSADEVVRRSSLIGNTKVTREDWMNLALETLISEGVEAVRVLALGQKLNVSRSSFYWYFKSRQDLLDQLLDYWRNNNTRFIVEQAVLLEQLPICGRAHHDAGVPDAGQFRQRSLKLHQGDRIVVDAASDFDFVYEHVVPVGKSGFEIIKCQMILNCASK